MPNSHLDNMRSRLFRHRELIERMNELRERPDRHGARLEEMAEEMDPESEGLTVEAIRLLIEAEQVGLIRVKQLEARFARVLESYMVATIDFAERTRPPGLSEED